jgi:hypothetical protein
MASAQTNQIEIERNLIIPLSDGAQLSADLYRPAGAGRFPTLLSFYPYHKDDMIGGMNELPRRYFASRGYAHLLIDFRGLGGSSGLAWDAMNPNEGRDGAQAVEWAAAQPWSDGNVGMWGMSYGGISSLKVAAEHPPHLKAIVPIEGSIDIYQDFLYPGGCLNFLGAFGSWGSMMLAMNLMPPTNADSTGRWYTVWQERLEHGEPYVMPWPDNPAYDEYWKVKAVEPERITIPAFIIGGWRDIFPHAMPETFRRLGGVKKLLMGPWMHTLPDLAPVEPLDYLAQMKRWFDRWLRGDRNGIDDEPPVTIFVQNGGGWHHEREWPIARSVERRFYVSGNRALAPEVPNREGHEDYEANPTVGIAAGLWDPTGTGVGMPSDQNGDDRMSLAFTSDAMAEDVEIAGIPSATIIAEILSGDDANIVAKLCDVAPDGASSLVTTGWLRATRRSGASHTDPIRAGETCRFDVTLFSTAYRVPKGHRIRLSISCADFPRIWPTKTNPRIRLKWGARAPSSISIPIAPAVEKKLAGMPLEPPPATAAMPPPRQVRWRSGYDYVTGTASVTMGQRTMAALPQGGTFEMDHTAMARVAASRPESATIEGDTTIRIAGVPVVGDMEFHTTSYVGQTGMTLRGTIKAGDKIIFEKQWTK